MSDDQLKDNLAAKLASHRAQDAEYHRREMFAGFVVEQEGAMRSQFLKVQALRRSLEPTLIDWARGKWSALFRADAGAKQRQEEARAIQEDAGKAEDRLAALLLLAEKAKAHRHRKHGELADVVAEVESLAGVAERLAVRVAALTESPEQLVA